MFNITDKTFFWYHNEWYEPANFGFRLFGALQVRFEWDEGPAISTYCFGPRYTRWWHFGLDGALWQWTSNINWKVKR